jgi:hypothetical protein
MDDGTLKTPIPKCRLYWSFAGSESGQKQVVKLLQNMVYNTTQHPHPTPPTASQCLYIYFGKGGRGEEVRKKVEGQQYTSIVPASMGATVHKLGRKYQQCVNASPVYKIC